MCVKPLHAILAEHGSLMQSSLKCSFYNRLLPVTQLGQSEEEYIKWEFSSTRICCVLQNTTVGGRPPE